MVNAQWCIATVRSDYRTYERNTRERLEQERQGRTLFPARNVL